MHPFMPFLSRHACMTLFFIHVYFLCHSLKSMTSKVNTLKASLPFMNSFCFLWHYYLEFCIESHRIATPVLTSTRVITRVILLVQFDRFFQSLFDFDLLHDVHLRDKCFKALLDVCIGKGGAFAHVDERFTHNVLFDLLRAHLPRLM